MSKSMKKDKKRKAVIEMKAKMESLRFQTLWGAAQKVGEIVPAVESRIDEELRLFSNLQLAADLIDLKNAIDRIKNELGHDNEPTVGLLAGSMVAYCLGLEPENPMLFDKTPDLSDLKLPLQLAVSYDNNIRNSVAEWLKANGYDMSTFLGQPVLKLTNSRVVIRRVVKD